MSHSLAPLVRYRVSHETQYAYQSAVSLSQQYLHLTPRSFAYQQIEAHRIQIEPGEDEIADVDDPAPAGASVSAGG